MLQTVSICLTVAMAFTAGLNLSGDLVPLEDAFLEAEKEFGVNATFLAAVAALESGWGTSELAKNNNNLFGWKSSEGYMSFDTKEDCINHVAKYLATNYLDPDGIYYHGDTVEDVAVSYCGGNPDWVDMIEGLMWQISVD